MISLIHLTNESNNTFTQYKDASNLTTRINLHDLYSNKRTYGANLKICGI